MQVLKVELEGMTTSFRYPHFLVGRQPSLPLPPPSTIYGHVASALGEWPDPATFRFGYTFHSAGQVDDLESQHIVSPSTGKRDKTWGAVKNLEGAINPTLRQVLLQPRLTLYIESPDLERFEEAFREPRYAVVLGRSQDLATYTRVTRLYLVEREDGYYEGTILPQSYRERTNGGILTQMAHFINPVDRREVAWAMYLAVEEKLHSSNDVRAINSPRLILTEPGQPPYLVDPETPFVRGGQRIVQWHSFVGDAERSATLV